MGEPDGLRRHPQEQIKRIFEPYYTTKVGSGLGLMIVQRIVRDHDGRLELMTTAARNDLPHLAAEGGTHAEIAWGKHGGRMTPNLLIVDDEKPTRDGLRAALEDRYEVYVAEDATSATGLLEAETFDVLLTDFRLPNNEDGMKLIARAKSLAAANLYPDDRLRLGGTGGGGTQAGRG